MSEICRERHSSRKGKSLHSGVGEETSAANLGGEREQSGKLDEANLTRRLESTLDWAILDFAGWNGPTRTGFVRSATRLPPTVSAGELGGCSRGSGRGGSPNPHRHSGQGRRCGFCRSESHHLSWVDVRRVAYVPFLRARCRVGGEVMGGEWQSCPSLGGVYDG